jgi:acetyl esterase/lipase
VPGIVPGGGDEVEVDTEVSNVHHPTLLPYPALGSRHTGTAVIICPGGGYGLLALEREGTLVARRLNAIGVSAFVLKYRLKEYGHPAPLRDVLRAIRLVRSQAARWQVEPDHIGVMGFSAGGHLAASAGTLFDAPEGRTGAELDRVSARPDFLVLVYPVITMTGPFTHVGSRNNLIGPHPSGALAEHLSADLQVTRQTPPAFLVHGGTDRTVPAENSVLFYSALRRNGVPAELHVYEEGPHGFGLEPATGPVADWLIRCTEWMGMRGWLAARRP